MGRLVEDMTRLVGEIQALRGSRRAFRKELTMDVFEMCADFADTHARMAKGAKEERLAFVENLKRTVGEQLQEIRAYIAGARRAWAGRQRGMRAEFAAAGRAWAEHGQQPEMSAEFTAPRRARAGRGA